MIEILVLSVAGILGLIFCYCFLVKYHTRHLGPGPQPGHRNSENKRRKRKEVVNTDTWTTGEILQFKRAIDGMPVEQKNQLTKGQW